MSFISGHLLRPTVLGSDPRPIDKDSGWLTSNNALAAATARLASLTPPANDVANGLVYFPLASLQTVALRFVASHTADPNNLTFTARVWGVTARERADQLVEFCGDHLMDLTLTTGNTALVSGSDLTDGANTVKYVDGIAASPDYSLTPGVRFLGGTTAGVDGWTELVFSPGGRLGIFVQLKIDNVTKVRVLAREF